MIKDLNCIISGFSEVTQQPKHLAVNKSVFTYCFLTKIKTYL